MSRKSNKELMEEFVEQYMESGSLAEDFAALSPWQRIQIFQRFSGFVLPRIKSVELELGHSGASPEKLALYMALNSTFACES